MRACAARVVLEEPRIAVSRGHIGEFVVSTSNALVIRESMPDGGSRSGRGPPVRSLASQALLLGQLRLDRGHGA
jgi:hypothetical protein